MGQPRWATKAGRTTFSRPIVAVAAIGVLMVLLVLLRPLDDDGSSSTTPPGGSLPAAAQPCVAGGVNCPAPPLQLCLDARGARIDCSAVLTDTSAPSSTSGWDWLLIAVVVITPFALVLGPLAWRTVRRTRRRNAEAFAADAGALQALGFVQVDDPHPAVFALAQACRRAERVLAREGVPRIWLFEVEHTTSLAMDRWPTRAAVFEPVAPLPSGALLPIAARKGPTRYRRTFAAGGPADALVAAVTPILDERPGQLVVAFGAGVVELRAVASPGATPLALSAVAAAAIEVAAALDLLVDAPA